MVDKDNHTFMSMVQLENNTSNSVDYKIDMYNSLIEKDWKMVDYLTMVFAKKDNPNEMFENKLKRIIKEKPELSPTEIRIILIDIITYVRIRSNYPNIFDFLHKHEKTEKEKKEDEQIIEKYFNKIYDMYIEKLTGTELVNLCMMIDDKNLCEKIIKQNYKKIKRVMRSTLYIPTNEIDELTSIWEIEMEISELYKKRNFKASQQNLSIRVLKTIYDYYENDIKIYTHSKITKYDDSLIYSLNTDSIFYLLQKEIRNNNNEYIKKFVKVLKQRDFENIELTNILKKSEWIRLLKNKELMKYLLLYDDKSIEYSNNIEKIFQSSFWDFIKDKINLEKISLCNINNIDSIYSLEFLIAIDLLKKESYNDNKKNKLFLICFKVFLKEFLKEYQDKLSNKDIEYLERIFRRSIQKNNIYKVLLINNRKNLIHNYKTNELLENTQSISQEFINNYNVKQYRNIKEIIFNSFKNYELNPGILSKKKINIYDNYIIISLNLLGYEATKKIIDYSLYDWKRIIDTIKDKDKHFIDSFKQFVIETTGKDKILNEYSLDTYLSVFEKILLNNQKPTLNKINKIIKSIKNLLVPYNIDIEENLELLNNVAKGEPFLEKINGIKLYENYRKRIKSSIPDYTGKYDELSYGLVSLHDKRIISNGIGKYLLPDNKKASSCLTPNGKAKTCLEHGSTNPNGRFFKIEKNDRIIAYSWVWRAGDILCFDNIELTEEVEHIKDYEKIIYEIYLKTAKAIVKKTQKEKNGGIKVVLIGRNPIDVKNKYIDTLQPLHSITKKIITPNSNEELYLKDSLNKVILYGEYNNDLDTKDVEPIYLYEREPIKTFSELDEKILKRKINSIYYDYCLQNSKKYQEIDNIYKSGYIGEDWFIGNKPDGTYDFYYSENDKRLFKEARKYLENVKEKQDITSKIYIPKYKIENILDIDNIDINKNEIEGYLNSLNTNDYQIKDTYFSHTTNSLKTLSQVFNDGAITSSNYGKHSGGYGTNGNHYICIAKVGSSVYNSYKETGTIIIDNNMQIFNSEDIIIPKNRLYDFRYTSYPIRETGTDGEYQVKDIITKDHFKCLLAKKSTPITLSQVILLNELFDLNLPIILESTMSKIDIDYIKKYIKLNK